MRVVVSELSGRGNLLSKAAEYGIEVGQGDEAGRRAGRDQGARGPGLRLRGRRSLGRDDDEAAGSELSGAVRADRLHGECRASAGPRHLFGSHGQGARAGFRRSAPHRRRGQWPGERAGQGAAQGATAALSRVDRIPARRLQGPDPGRQRRHERSHPRADRHPQRRRSGGRPSAPAPTSSKPAGARWPMRSSTA